jgi:hypothetical protein
VHVTAWTVSPVSQGRLTAPQTDELTISFVAKGSSDGWAGGAALDRLCARANHRVAAIASVTNTCGARTAVRSRRRRCNRPGRDRASDRAQLPAPELGCRGSDY